MNRLNSLNLKIDYPYKTITASTHISILQTSKKSSMAKHEQVNIQKVLKFSELSPSCFDQRQKSVVLLENVAEFVELNMIIQ